LIVSVHVASGALGGTLAGSRRRAAALGPLLHAAGDLIPHRDIPSRRFEIGSGLALLGLIAARRGVFDAAVVGGATAAAPDLEHVLSLPRPGGRKLFPSHRFHGWHQEGGVPAWAQLVLAGLMVGLVLSSRKER
jgi:hypothetical protein